MTTTAPVITREDVVAKIQTACGMNGYFKDGISIPISITEIAANGTGNSWKRRVPSGRFSISLHTGSEKNTIFRTKKDGTIPLSDIATCIDNYVTHKKLSIATNAIKESNVNTANDVRNTYKGKKYISAYSGTGSFVTPSTISNEVIVQINYGSVRPEIAEKIFISVRTVETHRHNILKKLNIPNAALLSSWAKDKGYI